MIARVIVAAAATIPVLAWAPRSNGRIDRLYIIDCGWAHVADQSVWSPGVNVGVPLDLSDNCYLLHHTTEGYLLWDTGITDSVALSPNGVPGREPGMTWHRSGTLIASLAALGLKPSDIKYIAISHHHPDHIGNVAAFPSATVILQTKEPFDPPNKTERIDGDKDLFGDGSLTLLFTPGHTPGHESLLVHLDKTGDIVLSGDLAHFQSNWDNRRVPSFNTDKAQSLASMEKVARLLKEKHAQLWINHDKPSSDAHRRAPEFYE